LRILKAAVSSLLLCVWACAQRPPVAEAIGAVQEVVFDRYTPLSRNEEIARRTLTPLTFQHGQAMLAATRQQFLEQPIDLTKEKFTLYVPDGAPPKEGYGLLVFIAPWSEPTRPQLWRLPLSRHGLIFVSAENSGNDVKVLDRRLPLALLAYENVRARFPLNPNRIYIGGLSGGSRAAEITALAYPDVFRGALLNAGSDPIGGEAGIYLPPAELFRKFREIKLVYVTGDGDERNLRDDEISRASMREWCVFGIEIRKARKLGHEPLDQPSFDQALDALERPATINPGERERCNERVQQELASKLAAARAAISRGDGRGARAQIKEIDAHYGGLAAPMIVDLDERLTKSG
jgi:pimeloyl-ACP methyl ester carboxylesterase